MLSADIEIFKTSLNNLLMADSTTDKGGPIYIASRDAFYEASKSEPTAMDPETPEDAKAGLTSLSDEMNDKVNKEIYKKAKIFAEEFCAGLKNEKLMDKIADAVSSHIKSLDVMVTAVVPNPTSGSTLLCGTIPVTGTIITSSMGGEVKIM